MAVAAGSLVAVPAAVVAISAVAVAVVAVPVAIVAVTIIVTIAITVVAAAIAVVPGAITVVIVAVTIVPGLGTVAIIALVNIVIAISPIIPALLLRECSAAESQRQQCRCHHPFAAFHIALQILLLTRLDEDIAPEHVTIRQGSVKCCKERMVWQ